MKSEAIILIGSLLVANFGLVILQPVTVENSAAVLGIKAPGEPSRKIISSVNLRPALHTQNIEKHDTHKHPTSSPNFDDDGRLHPGFLRERRSLVNHALKIQKSQPSAEMQQIMSGNWNSMDQDSLFRLLSKISKGTPSPYYYYDDEEEDPPPIDLVYSGKKPLTLLNAKTQATKTDTNLKSSTKPDEHSINFSHQSQPIPIMMSSSSGGKSLGLFDESFNEPESIHLSRLTKKWNGYYPLRFSNKRSHLKMGWNLGNFINEKKDLVQLPNGEIAFTPHGINVLRYHQPAPLEIDQGLPVIRRPIL